MTQHNCPICRVSLTPNDRYPRYVCASCVKRAKSVDGRALTFSNAGFSGGYVATYVDTGADYAAHECFVDGIACFADEARFGGIVIETAG